MDLKLGKKARDNARRAVANASLGTGDAIVMLKMLGLVDNDLKAI